VTEIKEKCRRCDRRRGASKKLSKKVMFLGPNYFGFYIIEDPGRILDSFMSFILTHHCFFLHPTPFIYYG
jgi:hypothetical protein